MKRRAFSSLFRLTKNSFAPIERFRSHQVCPRNHPQLRVSKSKVFDLPKKEGFGLALSWQGPQSGSALSWRRPPRGFWPCIELARTSLRVPQFNSINSKHTQSPSIQQSYPNRTTQPALTGIQRKRQVWSPRLLFRMKRTRISPHNLRHRNSQQKGQVTFLYFIEGRTLSAS